MWIIHQVCLASSRFIMIKDNMEITKRGMIMARYSLGDSRNYMTLILIPSSTKRIV